MAIVIKGIIAVMLAVSTIADKMESSKRAKRKLRSRLERMEFSLPKISASAFCSFL
ncbi:MAG: hypothetical protein LBE89_06875 [Helicobacteraceae bacterium]|nr:hypothetical protein [Helicobacteraceae bacterium]